MYRIIYYIIFFKLILDNIDTFLYLNYNIEIPGSLYTFLNGIILLFLVSRVYLIKEYSYFNISGKNILKFIIIYIIYLIFQTVVTNQDFFGIIIYIIYFLEIYLLLFIKNYTEVYKRLILIRKLLMFTLIIFILILIPIIIKEFSFSFRENRISGLFGNVNEDAGVIISFFPIFLITLNYKKRNKTSLLFIIITLFYMIFINGSRYAIAVLFITTFAYFYFIYGKLRLFKFFIFISIITVLFISVPLIKKYYLQDSSFNNIEGVIKGDNIEGNLAGRIGGIWIPSIIYTYENSFLLGFGVKSWYEQQVTFVLTKDDIRKNIHRSPHNSYVFNFYQFGLCGLVLYFILIYIGFKPALKSFLLTKKINVSNHNSILIICSWLGFVCWTLFANAWPRASFPIFILLFSYSLNFYVYNFILHEKIS